MIPSLSHLLSSRSRPYLLRCDALHQRQDNWSINGTEQNTESVAVVVPHNPFHLRKETKNKRLAVISVVALEGHSLERVYGIFMCVTSALRYKNQTSDVGIMRLNVRNYTFCSRSHMWKSETQDVTKLKTCINSFYQDTDEVEGCQEETGTEWPT